jgi:WD40 repeat protein
LDLVTLALQDDSEQLRRAAYLLLRERAEPKVKQTLKDYKPWQFVTCLHTLSQPSLRYYERRPYQVEPTILSVAISRDGQTVVSADVENNIKVWHIPTGQLTRTLGVDSWLDDVAISPDGQTLVSNGDEGTIQVWHLPTGQVSRMLTWHSAKVYRVYRVAISWDGQTLVSGHDKGTIQIWHLPTRELTRTWQAHSCTVGSIAISRDGQTLVSADNDKTIKVWHIPTGKLTRTLVENDLHDMSSVAVSPGGQTVVSAYVGINDLHHMSSVAVSPGGQTVVSACGEYGIKVSNLSMSPIGQMTRTLADPFRCYVVAISPDGETLISGSNDTIKIWHLPTGQLITTLVGHSDRVTSLAISQNGQTFVSGSKDGTIKVWGVP